MESFTFITEFFVVLDTKSYHLCSGTASKLAAPEWLRVADIETCKEPSPGREVSTGGSLEASAFVEVGEAALACSEEEPNVEDLRGDLEETEAGEERGSFGWGPFGGVYFFLAMLLPTPAARDHRRWRSRELRFLSEEREFLFISCVPCWLPVDYPINFLLWIKFYLQLKFNFGIKQAQVTRGSSYLELDSEKESEHYVISKWRRWSARSSWSQKPYNDSVKVG